MGPKLPPFRVYPGVSLNDIDETIVDLSPVSNFVENLDLMNDNSMLLLIDEIDKALQGLIPNLSFAIRASAILTLVAIVM